MQRVQHTPCRINECNTVSTRPRLPREKGVLTQATLHHRPQSPSPAPRPRPSSRPRSRTRATVALPLPTDVPLASLHSWRQIRALLSHHQASLAHGQVQALLARLVIVARKQRPAAGHLSEYREFLREALRSLSSRHLPSYSALALPSLMLIIAKLDFPDEEIAGVLGEAVVSRLASFTPSGLAITMWSLAKLGWAPGPAALSTILATSAQMLPSCSARDLANLSWALAKMGAHPPTPWLGTFLAASELQLPAMVSQDFANVLWGVAKMGGRGKVPGRWVDSFLEASRGKLKVFNPQELSNVIWALMLLGHRPGEGWLKVFLVSVGDSRTLSAASPQALANTFYALAKLRAPLPPEWLDDILSITVSSLPSFNPKDLANMVWALATLGHPPPPTWWAVFHSVSAQKLRACTPANLAVILRSCARLNDRPPREWVSKFFGSTGSPARLSQFAPRDIANTLWALAQLHIPLPTFWVAALCTVTLPLLPSYTHQDLAEMLWALGQQYAKPDAPWVEAVVGELQQRAATLPPAYIRTSLRGLAGLTAPLPEEGMRGLVGAVCPRLPTFDNQELVAFVVAVSHTGLRLEGEWGDIILTKANKRLASFTGEQLADLLLALAAMGSRPQPLLIDTLLHSSPSHMAALPPKALCSTLFSLCKLGHFPGKEWMAEFLPAATAKLPDFSPQDVSRLLGGLESMQARVPAEQLQAVVEEVLAAMVQEEGRRLRAFTFRDLTAVILAVCRLEVTLPEGWLDSFLAAATLRFMEAHPRDLAHMMWALGQLRADDTGVRWLHSYLNAAYQKLGDFSASDLANLVWGLGELRVRPSGDFMFRFLEVLDTNLANPRWGGQRELGRIHDSLVKLGDNGMVWW